MSEHSSVEKNIDLLRLFFKDLIEDQAIYEKSDSRVGILARIRSFALWKRFHPAPGRS